MEILSQTRIGDVEEEGIKVERKILVRCDDICPTMDFVRFEQAKEVFREKGIKPLLGVIPDCRDKDLEIDSAHEDFWEYVLKLQQEGYALAMHGCQHVFDTNVRGSVNLGFKSEFAGHSLEEQTEKIRAGKEILRQHGIETEIFFAPAHSYDDNTLRALAANGFKYMSDGWSLRPYRRHGIICLPCRTGGIPKIKKRGYYTVVLHAHEWNNPAKADAFDRFKILCGVYEDDFVSFEEYASVKCGITFIQQFEEYVAVLWRRHIFPAALKVYHAVRRR